MQSTNPMSRDRLLEHVSQQFKAIRTRVSDDVAATATGDEHRANSFVLYSLKDDAGEPLKDSTTRPVGLVRDDLERTDGFRRLKQHCERLYLKVRLDEHFYAEEPEPTKIFRLIVDGWD